MTIHPFDGTKESMILHTGFSLLLRRSPRAPAHAHCGDRPDTAALWRKSETWVPWRAPCVPSARRTAADPAGEGHGGPGSGGRRRLSRSPSGGQSAVPAPQRGFDTSLAGWVRRLGLANRASSWGGSVLLRGWGGGGRRWGDGRRRWGAAGVGLGGGPAFCPAL